MYRKGIRASLTSRVATGIAESTRVSEIPGGTPGNRLLARDFAPCYVRSFEDHIRKGDMGVCVCACVCVRVWVGVCGWVGWGGVVGGGWLGGGIPDAANVIARETKQKIEICGRPYGEEHVAGRLDVLFLIGEVLGIFDGFPHRPFNGCLGARRCLITRSSRRKAYGVCRNPYQKGLEAIRPKIEHLLHAQMALPYGDFLSPSK